MKKEKYYHILHTDIPSFIQPYLTCPSLERLKGIGLFCGVDYSCLFHPSSFYSRFDHSLGVALITYHFTHDKKATLSALFHDISTPIFSHAMDFKNKDYLHQESTEKDNARMILEDERLIKQLKDDGISPKDVLHDDSYPIANQKTPHICADRLEYMFSTGLFLTKSFTLDTIKQCYENLEIQYNGEVEELGFTDEKIAEIFFQGCLVNSKLFLDAKDKITLELLSQIVDVAFHLQLIEPQEIYLLSEKAFLNRIKKSHDATIQKYLNLLFHQTEMVTSKTPIENSFNAKLNVKVRYIDPLCHSQRLSSINTEIKQQIEALFIQDESYACLPYLEV